MIHGRAARRRMDKILAIKLKYLGDVAVAIPAFHSLKDTYPKAALHVAVAAEATPLLKHLPWIEKVWTVPRVRGKIVPSWSWALIQALRREQFDAAIDFVGNDRGALLTLFCGAKRTLGPTPPHGFFGRKFCYRQRMPDPPHARNEIERNLDIACEFGARRPDVPKIRMVPDPDLADRAREILPNRKVVCHLTTSQPKKEWPVEHWTQLARLASEAKIPLVFSSGPTPREQEMLETVVREEPSISIFPKIDSLDLFLAILAEAAAFLSADTGPLHFAAGLGVPTISLFGPSDQNRWAPVGPMHRSLASQSCKCPLSTHTCLAGRPCMSNITPSEVFGALADLYRGVAHVVKARRDSPK